MADPPTDPDSDDSGLEADRRSAASTPRWVKVFGIIALVVVLVLVILMLTGGSGGHGPGRHGGAGDTPTPSVSEHKPPSGVDHGG